MIKRIMASIALAGSLVLGGGFIASPAQANQTPGFRTVVTSTVLSNLPETSESTLRRSQAQCNEEQILCLWNGYNYTGTMWKITKATLGGTSGYSFVGSGINNASKGWYNRVNQTITMYDNDHCLQPGWDRNLLQGQAAVSYDAWTNDWDDRISSASLYTGQGIYC